jgi:diguanylate cyclase (GGDEF)-like protein
MLGIDPRSFIIISAAFGALCAFVFLALRSGFPRDIGGLGRWSGSCALMAAAALLFASRGSIPVLFSSFVPNIAVAAGVAGMRGSIRRFAGLRAGDAWPALLVGACALAMLAPTLVHDDYRERVVIMSATLAVLFGACGGEVLRLRGKSFSERYTAGAFIATACVMLVRCIAALTDEATALTPETDTSSLQHVYLGTFSFSIVALSMGFLLMVNRALQARLEALAMRDQLSGTFRRESFLPMLERQIAQSRRSFRPMCLLMLDLDNFKAINDGHGHLVGDRVISDFADKLRSVLRRGDLVGRYGGEEFLVLLPDTGLDAARAIARRILATAAQRGGELPPYTVSIGMAALDARRDHAAGIIDAADKALYAAKRAGKNRIELAGAAMDAGELQAA